MFFDAIAGINATFSCLSLLYSYMKNHHLLTFLYSWKYVEGIDYGILSQNCSIL